MATVKMTDRLATDITAKAGGLFNARLKAAGEMPVDWDSFGRSVVEAYLHEQGLHDVWAKMPSSWKFKRGWVMVGTVNGVTINSTMHVSQPIEVPTHVNQASGYVSAATLSVSNAPILDPYVEQFVARRDAVAAVEAARDAFVKKVTDLVKQYSTLNAAIRAWPGLRELVPAEDLERMLKPVTRSPPPAKPPSKEVGEDLVSELNGALVTHKILSAAG